MKTSNRGPGACRAFSVIEILVATAVLALLLVLTLQILSNTNTAIRTADRQIDAASQARAALDRFEADFNNSFLSHGATALGLPASETTPPAIGFLSRSRARDADSGSPAWRDDLRGAAVIYRMDGSQLVRGTLRITFSKEDHAQQASGNPAGIFQTLADALENGGSGLLWSTPGTGIVRFHLSYQLDNGEIVQTPPAFTMISPTSNDATTFLNGSDVAPCTAIAFSKNHAPATGSLSGRYVRSLIVTVAALDAASLSQSAENLDQLTELGTPGVGPSPESDTARALWENNLDRITFAPLRQNLRFFQRIIPVP